MILTDWPESIDLAPGGHVILLGSWEDGLEGRRRGLELRDTLMIVSAQEPRFAFLFRAELEGTVAENVLKHGTGGLNIGACRVTTGESLTGGAYSGEHREKTTEWQNSDRSEGKGSGFRLGLGEFVQPTGRWPTNLVFIHTPECKRDGTREVKSGMAHEPGGLSYVDSSGNESIPNWICTGKCPVKALDDQGKEAGIHSSGSPRGYKAGYTTEPGYTGSWSTNPYGGMRHDDGDAGSCASRFFPQFVDEAALKKWLGTLIGAV